MKRNAIAYTVLILVAATITAEASSTKQPDDLGILSAFEDAITKIVDQSKPAVVSLTVKNDEQNNNKPPISGGSGFIFRQDGYILTNEHVVSGAKSIEVRLFDGRMFYARVVGGDPNTDIAVIKIEGEEFPFLSLAESAKVRVGQFAIAIGDPKGFRYTVTAGIVGGKGRCHHPPKTKLFQYHYNYIQTDAWINKGSSGGPLLNIQGEVIGITTLNPGEGSSLAINSDLAKTIGNKLIAQGRVIRGYIDADMQNVSKGLRITRVKTNTSASQCGLKRNDIIVEFDEEKVPELYKFRLMVAECQIGKQYPIKVLRHKQEMTLNVTIDEMPLELVGRPAKTESASWKTLGLAVRELENGIFQRYTYLNEEDRGIIVEKVRRGSPGFNANIPRNALIVAINGQEIIDVQAFETYLQGKQDISNVTLDIKGIHGIDKVTVELNNN
jgi:S1-C subfamily serine protease